MDADSSTPSGTGGIFPRTRWSIVLSAKDPQKTENPAAMEELCRLYWQPVYLYIRGRGNSPTEAEDLAQEFFYRLLNGHYLKGVEGPERGRLRSFLCVVLKRFLADEYDKRMTQKRGGHWKAIPIDGPSAEARISDRTLDEQSPDLLFDRRWALDLMEHAVDQLRNEYLARGMTRFFEKLRPTISPQLDALPYAQLAQELEMTEGSVKVAVHRFRQRYRECLQSALRDTLQDPGETEEELRYLMSLFSRP